jgi:hypothetical protein
VKTRSAHRWIVGISLVLVLAASARAEEGAATVDELARRLNQGTVFDIVPLIHPDDRPEFAFAMSMEAASTLMRLPDGEAAERGKQEYGDILGRWGVKWLKDDEPKPQSQAEVTARTREMFQGVDIVGLAGALKKFTAEYSGGTQPMGNEGLGKLEGVKVEGNHATGTIHGKAFTLAKAAKGRWFLRLPTR